VADPAKELFAIKWFGQDAFLVQSAQLHKQMLIAVGFPKIYSLAQFWRDNEVVTPRHSAEAWGLDVEVANIASEDDVISLLSDLVVHIANATRRQYPQVVNQMLDVHAPVFRITYDNAIAILREQGMEMQWGEDPGYEREKALGRIMHARGIDIFFITQYPAKVKKFYTKLKSDPKYTATFDLILDGWEIASGAQRETNIQTLLQRIQEKKLKLSDYEDFLDIFRFGVPEHGGFCLGMDRVVAKLFGLRSVGDAILFPRNPGILRP
jgi:aspartyl-tRNA synthetase